MIDNSEYSFDLSYLNQVFQGNQVMIKQIISLFVQQVPDYINEMENCVAKMEFENLHSLAHKAKSSISMLGLTDMEELILSIEDKSKNNRDTNELSNLVKRVSEECNEIKSQLEKVLAE